MCGDSSQDEYFDPASSSAPLMAGLLFEPTKRLH